MTGRERFRLALSHREPDRIPHTDAPWATTVERWYGEGLPRDVSPRDYFDFQEQRVGSDVSLRLPEETVEETERYTIVRDRNGALKRLWRHDTSVPEYLDFVVRSRADWDALPVLSREFDAERVGPGLVEATNAMRENGRATHYFAHIGFNQVIYMVGMETMLVAMAREPAWAREMLDFTAEMIVRGAQEMMDRGAVFDGAFVADDMGTSRGPLFSPAMYRALVQPAHARVCAFFAGHGLPVILHSCGNVMALVPDIVDAGFACLQPLEVKAGMDLLGLKERYAGRLALMGGLDARTLVDVELMRAELAAKIPVAMAGGGYIMHSDHSIPDNVPLANFEEFIRYGLELGTYA